MSTLRSDERFMEITSDRHCTLALKELKTVLGKEGYYASKFTPAFFLHESQPISFTLVVDNFGIKYVNKADALHLEKNNNEPAMPAWFSSPIQQNQPTHPMERWGWCRPL